MNDFLQDVRYALRAIAKAPGFAAVVIVTLALGIGVNTTMYISANAVLFRPFPFQDPDQILAMRLLDKRTGESGGPFSYPDFVDVRAQATSYTGVAAFHSRYFNFAGAAGEPERIEGERVSPGTFELLGVRPAFGRTFRNDEGVIGGGHVVILGDGLWRRAFAGDSTIVGRTILLDGESYTVVGVMPPKFAFPADRQLWTPLQQSPTEGRGSHYLNVLARLKPGVSMAQAQVELTGIMSRLEAQYPADKTNLSADLADLHENEVGEFRPIILIMMGAVGFVLLIACANVANLLLTRSASRRREIAIRTALGAGRGRIIRQLLTESIILALCGAVGGVLLATWGNSLVENAVPSDRPYWMVFTMDWRVLTFTAVIAVATGLLFGLAPALQASRTDLNENLKEGGQGAGTGRGRQRLRGMLVVAEVALSMVLLVGAGLMVRSMLNMQGADPGFDRSHLLTLNVYMAGSQYDSSAERTAFLRDALARIAAVPGVRAAAASHTLPLTQSRSLTAIEPLDRVVALGEEPNVELRIVYGDLASTLGIPVRQGRGTAVSVVADTNAVMINETMARRVWPDKDAVGQQFRMARDSTGPVYTVAGVVADVSGRRLTDPVNSMMYLPYTRDWTTRVMVIAVRTDGDPLALAPAVRSAIHERDPLLPVFNVASMEKVFQQSFWDRRLYGGLFGSFAAIALLLSVVGLYAVVAYTVAQRTREIGVRMALGAGVQDVVTMVVRQGAGLTAIGIVLGLAGAYGITRLLRTMLFGVSATDPAVFLGVAALLGAIALLACLVPARRAASVNPVQALRSE